MRHSRKAVIALSTLCLSLAALGQDINYNYDRAANFSQYRTYQWIDVEGGKVGDQLTDQNIRRAVDEQLIAKGLQKVEDGGQLYVAYQAAIEKEKELTAWGTGGWPGYARWGGTTRAQTSTVDIGKLVIDLYDPANKQLVWRGGMSKALDIKKEPEKNYRNLQKALTKLFRNYPPPPGK